MKILLIDDDKIARRSLARRLERKFSCTVIECFSLSDLRSWPNQDLAKFDAVISDFDLADGCGVQVVAHLQRRAPNLLKSFIFYTGNPDPGIILGIRTVSRGEPVESVLRALSEMLKKSS